MMMRAGDDQSVKHRSKNASCDSDPKMVVVISLSAQKQTLTVINYFLSGGIALLTKSLPTVAGNH